MVTTDAERSRRYRERHPERRKASANAWYNRNKDKVSEQRKEDYQNNKEKYLARSHVYTRRLKLEVLVHYSGTDLPHCADPFHLHLPNDPFLTDCRVLSIDHINDDGADERERIFGTRRFGGGHSFYLWLKRNNYPMGYQVLCFNCQWEKVNKKDFLNHLVDKHGQH